MILLHGWRTTTLNELARDGYGFVDGPFGSNLPASDYTSTGVPIIRGSNLSLGEARFRDDEFVFVSHETAKRLERSLCGPEDIIFTKKGTLGQVGFIPKRHRFDCFLLSSNQMKLSVDPWKADPLYVYYYVSSAASRMKIVRDSEATGVPKINLAYLRGFPIDLPPLTEQRAISALVGALDDKIDLKRRTNETLERIARAIFKSWFVDFDPVRAKAEGRQPAGMDSKTAALFPSTMTSISGGYLPEGWVVSSLGEICELAYGRALKEEDRRPGSVPVLGSNGQVGWHDTSLVHGPGIAVGRKGNPGVVTWVGCDFFPIDTTFYVVPRGQASLCYLFHLIESLNLALLGADSAVPGLNRNMAYMSDVLLPPLQVQRAFEVIVQSLWRMEHLRESENRTLSALHDALLPKLLSGELRIRDAERMVEAHV